MAEPGSTPGVRELTERGARLGRAGRTAPVYRLYALAGARPLEPGLVRVGDDAVPAPLAIGTLPLEDGDAVKGFLCEAHAMADADDISGYGGWRAYLAGRGDA